MMVVQCQVLCTGSQICVNKMDGSPIPYVSITHSLYDYVSCSDFDVLNYMRLLLILNLLVISYSYTGCCYVILAIFLQEIAGG